VFWATARPASMARQRGVTRMAGEIFMRDAFR
jgi:hypothetical protein